MHSLGTPRISEDDNFILASDPQELASPTKLPTLSEELPSQTQPRSLDFSSLSDTSSSSTSTSTTENTCTENSNNANLNLTSTTIENNETTTTT